MCGIAGLLSTHKFNEEQSRISLNAMQSALAHRGPDGSGQYFCPTGMAALSHTRLSIIDLTESGHQPMHSNDGRLSITFNGEIYNYQALKAELEETGERFVSESDTEVLLRLYQREGEHCVKRLRGMFAFLIWDAKTQTAFAARDPLGIKPFYYSVDQQPVNETTASSLAFSSEIRSLLNASCLDTQPPTLSRQGLSSYLLRGTVSEPHTLIDGIHMLPAGHILSWQAGNTQLKEYWRLNFSNHNNNNSNNSSSNHKSTAPISNTEAITLTRKALESTITAHFVSDVPVGIFLSGGIDSTALVALASKVVKNTTLNTYSIAFEDPAWNEGDIAARVAKHFGTNHTEFLVTPEIAKPLFAEFLNVVDQPTIDGFNTFCVSKMAQQAGEKVVLSGVGGDELFAGYKSFTALPKMHLLAQKIRLLRPLTNFFQAAFHKYLPSKLQRSLNFLSQPDSLDKAHQSLRGIFSQQETKALCKNYAFNDALNEPLNTPASKPNSPTTDNAAKASPTNLLDRISELELSVYMRNQLLRDSDVMSMACSLELRVPFVDKEFVETISQIPAEIRLQTGKKLLVYAVPELPEWVVNRPKQGFRFPFDLWFADQWSSMPQPQNTPDWIKLRPWYRRWSLLVLNQWLDRHIKQRIS